MPAVNRFKIHKDGSQYIIEHIEYVEINTFFDVNGDKTLSSGTDTIKVDKFGKQFNTLREAIDVSNQYIVTNKVEFDLEVIP